MKNRTQKIVTASMLAALCAVATMVIKVPSPLGGYVNLGDAVVLLCGFMLPLPYAAAAAGIGSALADILLGYAVYAPATFLIKAGMAVIVFLAVRGRGVGARILGGALAELWMIVGYFLYEGIFWYGFGPSLVNIPANGIQGLAGMVLGLFLMKVLEKQKRA